jgi:hypothetical protein
VTVVCSAVWTSRLLAAFAGRISTVVSVLSAAMSWTRPAGMSRTAEMGAAGATANDVAMPGDVPREASGPGSL